MTEENNIPDPDGEPSKLPEDYSDSEVHQIINDDTYPYKALPIQARYCFFLKAGFPGENESFAHYQDRASTPSPEETTTEGTLRMVRSRASDVEVRVDPTKLQRPPSR